MRRSPADAFLEAILQNPDDDTPRLIYADWLDEQGDAASSARAEFIRVQCALATTELPQRRGDLERRQQQLLDDYGSKWVGRIRPLVQRWEFHRGFIDTVWVELQVFYSHPVQLFCRAPIQHLHLRNSRGPAPNMAVLADSWHLRNLLSLDLSFIGIESRGVRALVVSEHLTNLRELNLSHNCIGDSGVRALAGVPWLGRLERLDLAHNNIGAVGLRVLASALRKWDRSSEGLRLKRLELFPQDLSAAAQRVIVESSLLRRLVIN